MTELSRALQDRVECAYGLEDRAAAEELLLAYDSPNDPGGVERVRHAMLTGAKGDLDELRILLDAARTDYRDVLWWTGG